MPQKTNLNISPYYDDFDKNDNFYKVLFKPGQPVQARELTTLQSVLQNQVESVGSHLFKDGSIIGLNENLLHAYVEYIANRRLKALGYKTLYDRPLNTNPLPWTQHWLSSSGLQVAPQETEVESYIIGGIKHDVDEVTQNKLKGFKL